MHRNDLPACRRLLFPLLHADKGNRRRLRAGKGMTNTKTQRNFNPGLTSSFIERVREGHPRGHVLQMRKTAGCICSNLCLNNIQDDTEN